MKTIVLTGMMGAGKTSAGKLLAEKLGCVFIDSDLTVEQTEQISISEIFEKFGEDYFREKEFQTIQKILAPEDMVIALGGGAFENENIRKILIQNAFVVYLETSPETIYKRIKNDTSRPLLKNNMTTEKISQIINKRKKNYKLATHTVITDNKSTEEIVSEIIKCVY